MEKLGWIIVCILLAVGLAATLLCCCDQQGVADGSIRILTWNVQNLCDDVDNGVEYSEYTTSGGWTSSMYKARIRACAQTLAKSVCGDCDIIVLNEVENQQVVEDLLSQRELASRGFLWYAICGEPASPIRTAVLSRIPICQAAVHAVEGTRPVLQVSFDTHKGTLYVLAIHGKSKVEGADETKGLRLATAKAVQEISLKLQRSDPGCAIAIAGDFNEGFADCNMMADISKGVKADSPLRLLGTQTAGCWYCFWLDSSVSTWPGGSYLYNGKWEMIDNILFTSDAPGSTRMWVTEAGVVFAGPVKSADGKPYAWNRQLLSGVSDHLPVYIVIE